MVWTFRELRRQPRNDHKMVWAFRANNMIGAIDKNGRFGKGNIPETTAKWSGRFGGRKGKLHVMAKRSAA